MEKVRHCSQDGVGLPVEADPSVYTSRPKAARLSFADRPPVDRHARVRRDAPIQHFFDYGLVEKVGESARGIVYQAWQYQLNRRVALRLIPPDMMTKQFLQKALTTATLDHPNIVSLYDVGEHNGQPYLSMEFVEGCTLTTVMSEGQTDLRDLLQIVKLTARALHYAHQHGIAHGSLNPESILIDRAGQPHIANFGFEPQLERTDCNGLRQGERESSRYLAPEQVDRTPEEITPAVDVYAMGAILYRLVTGEAPLNADASTDRQPADEQERDLLTICDKCMAREPGQRYGSVSALTEALDRWLGAAPTSRKAPWNSGRFLKGEPDQQTDPTKPTTRPIDHSALPLSQEDVGEANPEAPSASQLGDLASTSVETACDDLRGSIRTTSPSRPASSSQLEAGSELAASSVLGPEPWRFGDYQVYGRIGFGGMGEVWRAKEPDLDRWVALKMIRSDRFARELAVRRFLSEPVTAARLDHPNIVPIYKKGTQDGQHYFSMKLVEGHSLAELMPRMWDDLRKAVRTMVKVARAVHHAHQRNVLHRDLKPGNILIDERGDPHVTDFGLAKQIKGAEADTLDGQVMGTPEYMAPEQAAGRSESLTTGTDVYALGAILYEMLTGRPPVRGKNALETIRKVVEEKPLRPSAIIRKVDRDLELICLKCLEKDPGERYGSADALADDFERWLNFEPVLAVPPSFFYQAGKMARRHLAGTIAVCGTVILMVAATAFSIDSSIRAQRDRVDAMLAAKLAVVEKQRADKEKVKALKAADISSNAVVAATTVIKHYKQGAVAANAAIDAFRNTVIAGFLGLPLPNDVPQLKHDGAASVAILNVLSDLRRSAASYFQNAPLQNQAEARAAFAAFLAKEGCWDEAREELKLALELWPNAEDAATPEFFPYMLGLASSYWTNRLDPTNPEAFLDLIDLAKVLLQAERPTEAKRLTDNAFSAYEQSAALKSQASSASGNSSQRTSFQMLPVAQAKSLAKRWSDYGEDDYSRELSEKIDQYEGLFPELRKPSPPTNLRLQLQ